MTGRREAGMRTRRAVLGDSRLDRDAAAKTAFDEPFQAMITEVAWGTDLTQGTVGRRERSMPTIAILAATDNFEKVPVHARATANTVASADVFSPESQPGSALAAARAFACAAAHGKGRK